MTLTVPRSAPPISDGRALQQMLCRAFDVLPGELGIDDPECDSRLSLRRQRAAAAKEAKRAPGNFQAALEAYQLSEHAAAADQSFPLFGPDR